MTYEKPEWLKAFEEYSNLTEEDDFYLPKCTAQRGFNVAWDIQQIKLDKAMAIIEECANHEPGCLTRARNFIKRHNA